MKTSKLNDLIGGSPSITAPFTPALNNIRGGIKKVEKMPMKKMAPKSPMKQYGDKGYKPADGSGTGM